MQKAKIGLIGLVGNEMKEDCWGTIKKLADIGLKGVEFTAFLLEGDVDENIKRYSALGMKSITCTTSKDALANNLKQVIANAKKIQAPHVSLWSGPTDSKEQLLDDAKFYNTVGKELAAEGLKLCYHNHDHEFNTFFNGMSAIDILAEYTDPGNFYFEFDCCWITYGGADPVYTLKKYAGRVPAIHIKDLVSMEFPDRKSVIFSVVGTGIVKTYETVKTAIEIGVDWVVIEQDRLRNLTPMETVTASYLNLKEMGLAL